MSELDKFIAAVDLLDDKFSDLREKLRAACQAIKDAISSALKPIIHAAIERHQRIARIKAMVPQHLRGNPMCRDPWHRGRRA